MPEDFIQHKTAIMDASCVINIAHTGEMESIFESLPVQVAVSSYVLKQEILSFMNRSGDEVPIDLSQLIASGIIEEATLDLTNEAEPEMLVELEAENLDAGEAESAAIALCRNWAIAVDDKRAINVIREREPKIQIITTPDIIKHWADAKAIDDKRIRQAIRAIRKYVPPKSHPLYDWWQQYV